MSAILINFTCVDVYHERFTVPHVIYVTSSRKNMAPGVPPLFYPAPPESCLPQSQKPEFNFINLFFF